MLILLIVVFEQLMQKPWHKNSEVADELQEPNTEEERQERNEGELTIFSRHLAKGKTDGQCKIPGYNILPARGSSVKLV